MARCSAPYYGFKSRLDEVSHLVHLASQIERVDPVGRRKEINALCRGAIVLLCSHLEAYIKELGEVAIDSLSRNGVHRTNLSPQFFFFVSQERIKRIKDTEEPSRVAEAVFEFVSVEGEFWSKTGPFVSPIPVDQFNKGFSNPAYDKIAKYFNRFGYADFKSSIKKRLKGKHLVTTNMVEHLVDTRNKIAHGDPTATKTPVEVTGMIKTIQFFCFVTDDLFSVWWRKNFCSIR